MIMSPYCFCSASIHDSCTGLLPSCAMKNLTTMLPACSACCIQVDLAASLYGLCSLRVGTPMNSFMLGLHAASQQVSTLVRHHLKHLRQAADLGDHSAVKSMVT